MEAAARDAVDLKISAVSEEKKFTNYCRKGNKDH